MESNPTRETLLQHGRFVRELAHALLRDAHAAEDVAQEAALQWLRRGSGIANPRAWLRRAVQHLALNQRRAAGRRKAHEESVEQPEPPRSPADEHAHVELLQRVVEAVSALDEPYRATILGRYFHGLSAREVAEREGVTLATVRSRERRALEILRARLDRGAGGREVWTAALSCLAGERPASRIPFPGALAALGVIAAIPLVVAWSWTWKATAKAGLEDDTSSTLPSNRPSLATAEVSHARAPIEREPTSSKLTDELDESGLLRGIATDVDGRPLPGVHVVFTRGGSDLPFEATSSEDGRFAVAGLAHYNAVRAELAGYALLHWNDPEEHGAGPWGELRLVLARTGRVGLRALDARGQGLVGVRVRVRPLLEECCEVDGSRRFSSLLASVEQSTDDLGTALLEGVWSGVKLECSLALESDSTWTSTEFASTRQVAGRLVLEPRLPGAPILVPCGGSLELEAVWETELHLHGEVVWPDGSASGAISIVCSAREDGARERDLLVVDSEDGRFDVRLREPYLPGSLVLRASKAGPDELRIVLVDGQAERVRSPSSWMASCELDPRTLDEGREVRLELREQPSRLGAVRVSDAEGRPLDAELVVFRPSLSSVLHRPTVEISGGPKVFLGFPSGPLVLAVFCGPTITGTSTRAHLCRTEVTDGVSELRVPHESAVRVHLKVPQSVERAMVMTQLWLPAGEPAPSTSDASTLSHPWPSGIPAATCSRTARDHDWLTATFVEHAWPRAGEFLLEPGDPGWYRFGLQAWDARGHAFAPRASELAWFDAGEHVLECELVPTATLSGRLVADGAREFLGLALVDERGLPIPLATSERSDLVDVLPVATHGRFRLEGVPLGHCRLRAGRIDELEAGRYQHEVALDVQPEQAAPLEIRF